MAYKKNDILIFMTKAPGAHACEMFGHGTAKPEDAEREPYYGFVKSVISASKGIYLMHTIKPLKGFFCVAEDADVLGERAGKRGLQRNGQRGRFRRRDEHG